MVRLENPPIERAIDALDLGRDPVLFDYERERFETLVFESSGGDRPVMYR